MIISNAWALTEIMQRQNGPDKAAEEHHHQAVVCLGPERASFQARLLGLPVQVWQEVEYVLQVVHDLMIDGQLAANDERKVVSDLDQTRMQSLE